MDNIFDEDNSDLDSLNENGISEKERFIAGKQILFGISVLYIFTISIYMINPHEGAPLLEICKTIFPPLATLIMAAYFREKQE